METRETKKERDPNVFLIMQLAKTNGIKYQGYKALTMPRSYLAPAAIAATAVTAIY